MVNDFVAAIVSIGILLAVFLFGWSSDIRRIRRSTMPELPPTAVDSLPEVESLGALQMGTE
jgi:hypothetical protein